MPEETQKTTQPDPDEKKDQGGIKTEVRVEAKAEPPVEAKVEVKTEAPVEAKKEEVKAEAPTEPKVEAKVEAQVEVKAEAKPEIKAETQAEAKAETKSEDSDNNNAPPKLKTRAAIEPTEAHVLVVEDNVPNFVLIARMLAYMGVQRCEWKTSGWQVVEFADTLPRIDLVLMDIRLPYEDGFQALEKLRSNPRLKDTLIIAVTAEASTDQMKRAKESGFDGFLGKPLDPDRFPDQIRRVLSGEAVWEMH